MTDTSVASDVDDDSLFRRYAASRDRKLRNEIVERHLGLAAHIAQALRNRPSVRDDDLRQVAMLGLVKAVDRFDPDYGAAFSSFAATTIEGELKRYFRDRTWTVRVPRSAKELHLADPPRHRGAVAEERPEPDRRPVGRHLQVDRDDVLRGLAATAAYSVGTHRRRRPRRRRWRRPARLPRRRRGRLRPQRRPPGRRRAARSPARARARDRPAALLRGSVAGGDRRARSGISQMHVSRLLRRVLRADAALDVRRRLMLDGRFTRRSAVTRLAPVTGHPIG